MRRILSGIPSPPSKCNGAAECRLIVYVYLRWAANTYELYQGEFGRGKNDGNGHRRIPGVLLATAEMWAVDGRLRDADARA